MSLRNEIAVVGAYEHPRRWAPDKTAFQIAAESARGALEDAGHALHLEKAAEVNAAIEAFVTGKAVA